MKISNQQTNSTDVKYLVNASAEELARFREAAVNQSKGSVKVPGFRPGKAPKEMIEKYIDPEKLQNDFLNLAINDLYLKSIDQLKLRVVNEPQLNITKFVPYQTLEFSVTVDIIAKITLSDYRKLDVKLESLPVKKDQLDNTVSELRKRTAKYIDVERAAKLGDQLIIDFKGLDSKTKKELPQASGMDYSLVLGSKSFIPGFEEKLVGVQAGKDASFEITFPSDYHDQAFKSRKVTFKVKVRTIQEVELPVLDDKFAASIGPFKSVKELETELKKQLEIENNLQANRQFEDKILNKLAETTKVAIPESLIHSEVHKLMDEAKQSALYRGQSWEEFLASLDLDENAYHDQLKPLAVLRIKGGLAIGEVATKEGLDVSRADLEAKIAELKKQYPDPKMQEELNSQANRREIMMRLLTEKVLANLKAGLTTKKSTTK